MIDAISAFIGVAAIVAAVSLQFLQAHLQRKEAIRRAMRALYAAAVEAYSTCSGVLKVTEAGTWMPRKAAYHRGLVNGALEALRSVPVADLADLEALGSVVLLRSAAVTMADHLTDIEELVTRGQAVPVEPIERVMKGVTEQHAVVARLCERHQVGL